MGVCRDKVRENKEEIRKLFEVDGRSYSYISRELKLNRRELTNTINDEFCFTKATVRHPTKRIENLITTHKDTIIELLKNDKGRILDIIYSTCGVNETELVSMRANDKELEEAVHKHTHKETGDDRAEAKRVVREEAWSHELTSMVFEEWRDVVGFEGLYKVSNLGRLRNKVKIMRPQLNVRHNRNEIVLSNDGVVKNSKLYRLIAQAFIPNPENKETVNHIDGDSTNDCLYNLEWSTQKEQNNHKNKVLKRTIPKAYGRNGKFKSVILNDIHEFGTIIETAEFLGVSQTTIQRYLSGESKTKHKLVLTY